MSIGDRLAYNSRVISLLRSRRFSIAILPISAARAAKVLIDLGKSVSAPRKQCECDPRKRAITIGEIFEAQGGLVGFLYLIFALRIPLKTTLHSGIFSVTGKAGRSMNLKIVDLQSHEDDGPLA